MFFETCPPTIGPIRQMLIDHRAELSQDSFLPDVELDDDDNDDADDDAVDDNDVDGRGLGLTGKSHNV